MIHHDKVMFVGDVHLKAQNPVCRKDNYAEAILLKLKWILSYCMEKKIDSVVFLGDLFDAPTVAWSLFTQVMQLFQSFCENGITCYTIVGNHDIRYDRLDTLNDTSLGVLLISGFLKRLSENPINLNDDGLQIIGYDFSQKIISCDEDRSKQICVAHEYFQCGFSDTSLQTEDLDAFGYGTYVFGHDHAPYMPMKQASWTLYRPGSLSRNSSDAHNLMRIPRVLVYDVSSDHWGFVDVSVAKKPDEVIMRNQDEVSLSMFDLVETLCSSYDGGQTSVRAYVSDLGLPNEINNIVTQYLDKLGV